MSWLNEDGLFLKYGTEKAAHDPAGEYRLDGPLHMIELKVDLTTLGTAASVLSDVIFFPKNARIEEVEIVVDTAATGTGAVLNVGLQQTDRSTEIDYDGFVAALALTALDTAGEKTVLRVGSTGAGALIGATNATVGYITADYDTAAYTAGVIYIRIKYYAV